MELCLLGAVVNPAAPASCCSLHCSARSSQPCMASWMNGEWSAGNRQRPCTTMPCRARLTNATAEGVEVGAAAAAAVALGCWSAPPAEEVACCQRPSRLFDALSRWGRCAAQQRPAAPRPHAHTP